MAGRLVRVGCTAETMASPSSPARQTPAFCGWGEAPDGENRVCLTIQKTPGTALRGACRVPPSALKDASTRLNFAGAINHFRCGDQPLQAWVGQER